MPRWGLPSLIPFIVEAEGFSAGSAALLLGAFFPGYLAMMMPSGWAAQKLGGKGVLTAGQLGTGVLLLLAPLCRRVPALCAVLTVMGCCQAPLIPAQAVLKRAWVPTGQDRPIALRVLSLGSKASALVATSLTPWLAILAVGRRVIQTRLVYLIWIITNGIY